MRKLVPQFGNTTDNLRFRFHDRSFKDSVSIALLYISTPFEVKLYDCFFTSVNPRSLCRVSLIEIFLHLIIADASHIPFRSSGLMPLGFLVSILPDNMLKLSPG
jgi:hypothetical protein